MRMTGPLLIGIGASHSGAGKTFLASMILRHFTQLPSPLAFRLKCGAIKYTRTGSGCSLVTDRAVLMEKGKDTWHMLTSGASDVAWVRSCRSGLSELLPDALKRLSSLDLIIVEGNSAIEFLKPDIVIFIFGKGKHNWKPGIEKLAAAADFIIHDPDVRHPAEVLSGSSFPRADSYSGYRGFFSALTRMVHERRVEAGNDEKGGGRKTSLRRCQKDS